MTFQIYIRGHFEVDADNEEEAKKKGKEVFDKYNEVQALKLDEPAKVADKSTGFFVA